MGYDHIHSEVMMMECGLSWEASMGIWIIRAISKEHRRSAW
jgi:hypothetical protein